MSFLIDPGRAGVRRLQPGRFLRRAALLLLASGSLTCSASASPGTATTGAPSPIVIGQSFKFRSKILDDTRQINVFVPPAYGPKSASYDVVYLVDGALDQDFEHIAGLAQLGALSWTFRPPIVVGIQTKNRQLDLTPPAHDPRYIKAFPRNGGADRFLDFLQREVIPFIDHRYPTGPRRVLMGESLAGLFVVHTFLNHPEPFTDFVAVSPSLWWDDRAEPRVAAGLIGQHDYSGRRLYLAVGDEGGTMQSGVDMVLYALRSRPPAGLSLHYADKSRSEAHDTIYHGAALEALRWMFPMPPAQGSASYWFMIDGAAPPDQAKH